MTSRRHLPTSFLLAVALLCCLASLISAPPSSAATTSVSPPVVTSAYSYDVASQGPVTIVAGSIAAPPVEARSARSIVTSAGDISALQRDFVAAETVGGLAESGTLSPAGIRFSQNSISGAFRDGGSVKQLAADLRSGAVDPSSIPPIRVLERGGNVYTLDNRRLAAFQEAGVDVPYRLATPQEIAREGWKFTTTNDGTSILIRGGG